MSGSQSLGEQYAADIRELKTDVKYIVREMQRFESTRDLVARHDERISDLEEAEHGRRSMDEQRTVVRWSGWWSAKVALISGVTVTVLTFVRGVVEHYCWKIHH